MLGRSLSFRFGHGLEMTNTSAFSSDSCPVSDVKLTVVRVGLAFVNPPSPVNSLSPLRIRVVFILRRSTSRQRIIVLDAPVSSNSGNFASIFSSSKEAVTATKGAGGR